MRLHDMQRDAILYRRESLVCHRNDSAGFREYLDLRDSVIGHKNKFRNEIDISALIRQGWDDHVKVSEIGCECAVHRINKKYEQFTWKLGLTFQRLYKILVTRIITLFA